MTKKNLTALMGLIISFCSFGQESQYFSMYFQAKVNEKSPYRRIYERDNNKFLTKDLQNDSLQLSGIITGTNDIEEINYFLMYIKTNGQENLYQPSFKRLNGEFIEYYKTGKPNIQILYRHNNILYSQVWDEDGKEQLINGSGI